MTNDTQKVFNFIKTHPIGTHFHMLQSVTEGTNHFTVNIYTKPSFNESFNCSIDSLEWKDTLSKSLTDHYELLCNELVGN